MSILSGFFKTIKYRMTDQGYKWQSEKTSSQTVVMGDGTDNTDTAEKRFGAIKGLTSSTSVTDTGYALDATIGKKHEDSIAALNQSLGEYKFLPRYDAVIGTMTSPSQEYTCDCNCFLIGTIKGTSTGWASVRSTYNKNYYLALETTQNETAICIPFKKGDKIFLGSTGIYNLGVARAD